MSIEAVEAVIDLIEMGAMTNQEDIVKCLRSAIGEPEKQEPVATYICGVCGVSMRMESAESKRQWVGLTEDEINEYDYEHRDFIYDIEALLKHKNTRLG